MHTAQSMHTVQLMHTEQAPGRCLSLRLFKTFVHVVEPVKSPYNAAVRRDSGEPARKLRVTYDPLSRQIGCQNRPPPPVGMEPPR